VEESCVRGLREGVGFTFRANCLATSSARCSSRSRFCVLLKKMCVGKHVRRLVESCQQEIGEWPVRLGLSASLR
jgi:hypothetical protein